MSLTSDDGQQNPGLFQHRPAGTNFERAFAHIQVPTSRAGLPPSQPSVGVNAKVKTHNPRAVLVSRRQAGNPLLKFIRNVPWEHADILADYQMGSQTCALFLSVRFHLLKPKYIYSRMEQLQTGFKLRVLICHIDTEDSQKTLTDIHKAAILNNWTLILSWSPEESARYLETYQTYEHKQADSIQERVEGDYMSRLTDVLTNVRSVNRTDVANLSTSLGSLANIMTASRERLALCPGVGEKKIQRLFEAFREPFRQVEQDRLVMVVADIAYRSKSRRLEDHSFLLEVNSFIGPKTLD
ncbi:ERCC1/Rad10 nucleotide excision repair [Guillardia theta CCMP2712]|uniref:DNA excision repair protein ERCC-1 n=1 Tax=Guillardia theta (strain CCMP2712) TaxID=905079 RepID=L1JHD5_GUITC|nr:ERCC1/Rad10 nucleotide excision repair [Guillardia theta CCMP2712]EKX47737.1 ERCC1/Rad10 nucleotide excision repair [Guillardia theta CCMP2712]|eukprot:XP_005834717.1 ERCC1/Rad10 nucleotide excision repair [Guillardia theta CCMP2712]